jgi:hypothetical protein
MKKSVLALSISTAIGTFAMVGSAFAITDLGVANSLGNATQMKVNNSGIGHNLIVPYYSAQGANATLLTLTNTTTVGKAVKIRFRGAENSDDVKDFQVFLSPADVWTAMVSQSATGAGQIVTNDRSCTKPAMTAGTQYPFGTERLSSATNFAGTREGYIEIFNMADVTAGSALATTITHVAGVPPCSAANFVALDTDASAVALAGLGLGVPTTGLTAGWTIINTATGAAYGGNAMAIQALTAAGVPANGNIVYWPQSVALISGETRGYTADPLLAGNLLAVPLVNPVIKALMQDLPDMSTPYMTIAAAAANGLVVNAGTPIAVNAVGSYLLGEMWAAQQQAYELTKSLAVMSVTNEFFSDSASVTIGAATDWVFSMPTRRYTVAMNYGATGGAARVYTDYTEDALVAVGVSAAPRNVNYFSAANTTVQGTTICVDGITPQGYNREEGTNGSVSFSPSVTPVFCGEVGVWGVNQTITATSSSAVLLAQGAMTAKGISFAPTAYSEGWMRVATPGLANIGLPVVGGSFTKAASNASTNYGWNTDHRYTRVAGYVY